MSKETVSVRQKFKFLISLFTVLGILLSVITFYFLEVSLLVYITVFLGIVSGCVLFFYLTNPFIKQLENSEFRTRTILETAADAIITFNGKSEIESFNEAASLIFGYSESEILKKNISLIIPAPFIDEQDDDLPDISQSKEVWLIGINRKLLGKRKDGTIFPVEMNVSEAYFDGSKMYTGFVRDISIRVISEDRLKLFGKVFANSTEGIVITDSFNKIVEVNEAYCNITGFKRSELLGQDPKISKSGRHGVAFYKEMWKGISEQGQWEGEVWDRKKGGEIYPRWLSVSTVKNKKGEITHYVGIVADITTIKQTEQNMEHLSHYDTLTQLPNRILFRDRLYQALAQAKHHNWVVAVLFVDIDRFKTINDTLGHSAGDQLLIDVSKRLVASLFRESDTVARLGGDEFIIALSNIGNSQNAATVAKRIITALSKPFTLEGHEVLVTASTGITLYPNDADNIDQLIKNSDKGKTHAKQLGKNNYQFFSPEMNIEAFEQLDIEISLRQALERDEFLLYYQPQVSLVTEKIIGMEALIRWRPSKSGLVSPDKFIPLAEETGLIIPIGEWVLRTACKQTKQLLNDGYAPIRVSVNLSSLQSRQLNLVDTVTHILNETGLDANLLELEITESAIMENVNRTVITLNELKAMGIHLAVDDFGTGYSSLNYLKRFPIDTLKIDKSFTEDIPDEPDNTAITAAIIAMAHSLKLSVIAEGVEREDQLCYLKSINCDEIQGYYYSPPVSYDDLRKLLDADNRENE